MKENKSPPKVTQLIFCRDLDLGGLNLELTYSDQEENILQIKRSFLDDELKIIYFFKMPLKFPIFPNNDNKYMHENNNQGG